MHMLFPATLGRKMGHAARRGSDVRANLLRIVQIVGVNYLCRTGIPAGFGIVFCTMTGVRHPVETFLRIHRVSRGRSNAW